MSDFPLWLAGALLSIVGSTFSNLGVNIQKFSAMREVHRETERGYWCQPLWVLGFGFVTFGSLFDFTALAFAAQSIVATVGSVTLVANIFFAHFWLGESLSKRDLLGTFLILAGATVAIAFGDQTEVQYSIEQLKSFYSRTAFIVYIIAVGAIMCGAYWCVRMAEPISDLVMQKKKEHRAAHAADDVETMSALEQDISDLLGDYEKYERVHPIAYCALAGFFGSLVLIFAKSTAELIRITAEEENQFDNVVTYVFIVCMFACVFAETHFLATGLKHFDALYIVPVFQCFFVSQGASAGGVFFGEFSRFGVREAILFPVGVTITIGGVYVLSSRQMGVSADADAADKPDQDHMRRASGFKEKSLDDGLPPSVRLPPAVLLRRKSQSGFMVGERGTLRGRAALDPKEVLQLAGGNLPVSAGSVLFSQLMNIPNPFLDADFMVDGWEANRDYLSRVTVRAQSAVDLRVDFKPSHRGSGSRVRDISTAPNHHQRGSNGSLPHAQSTGSIPEMRSNRALSSAHSKANSRDLGPLSIVRDMTSSNPATPAANTEASPASRPGSGAGSQPTSRPPSRPASRAGAMTPRDQMLRQLEDDDEDDDDDDDANPV